MSHLARPAARAARPEGRHVAVDVVARSHGISRLPRALVCRRLAGIDAPSLSLFPGTSIAGPGVAFREEALVTLGCAIDDGMAVDIGERRVVGPGMLLCTTTHEPGPSSQRAAAPVGRPIVLGAGSWLGAGATIVGGAASCAGRHHRDCGPGPVYARVPGREPRRADLAQDGA